MISKKITTILFVLLLTAFASPAYAQNYSYPSSSLVNDGGTIYFISGTVKVPFTSWAAFTGLGYSGKNVSTGDLSDYTLSQGYTIDTSAGIHPWGQWLESAGTVYYSVADGLIPVPSSEIFTNNGGQWSLVVKANKYDLAENTNLPLLTDNDLRIISAPTTTPTSVNTAPTAPSNITTNSASTGTLNLPTLSTTSPTSQFILGNAQNQTLAAFNFTASGSPATIQELDFNIQTSASGISTLPITQIMGGGGNATVIGYSTSSLKGLNIIVPASTSGVTVPITANLAGINPPASPSNQTFTLNLTGISYLSGGQTIFMPVNLASNSMNLVGSIPSVSISGPSGTLVDGLTLLGQVTVSATGGVGLSLNQLPLVITTSGNAVASSSPNNILVLDGGATVNTSNSAISFGPGGSASTNITFNSDNFIPAGSSKTYTISLVLTGAVGSTAGLSTVNLSLGAASGFIFSDTVGQSTGLNITGNTNNIIIPNYPVNIITAHN